MPGPAAAGCPMPFGPVRAFGAIPPMRSASRSFGPLPFTKTRASTPPEGHRALLPPPLSTKKGQKRAYHPQKPFDKHKNSLKTYLTLQRHARPRSVMPGLTGHLLPRDGRDRPGGLRSLRSLRPLPGAGASHQLWAPPPTLVRGCTSPPPCPFRSPPPRPWSQTAHYQPLTQKRVPEIQHPRLHI